MGRVFQNYIRKLDQRQSQFLKLKKTSIISPYRYLGTFFSECMVDSWWPLTNHYPFFQLYDSVIWYITLKYNFAPLFVTDDDHFKGNIDGYSCNSDLEKYGHIIYFDVTLIRYSFSNTQTTSQSTPLIPMCMSKQRRSTSLSWDDNKL